MMLHSVGVPDPAWHWNFLTMPLDSFTGFLRLARRAGYVSVTLDEYREAARANRLAKERLFALTFDDGYLDNWVYAAPVLREYGFTGTVFVSTDFIDPGSEPRPQWNGGSGPCPAASGYLNTAELRLLNQSGVLDVQSHAATHTWYPCGPRIVDFRSPGDGYCWMDWNADPGEKWRSLTPPGRPECWGEPVYEHCKALAGPRYYPCEELEEALRTYVAPHGEDFFKRPGWKDELFTLAAELQRRMPPGVMESREEYLARAEAELTESDRILEQALGKKIRWLCWPGGGYSPELFALAGQRYAGTSVASHDRAVKDGEDASGCYRLRRFGPLTAGSEPEIRYLHPFVNLLHLEEQRAKNPVARLVRGSLTRLARRRTP